MDRSEFEGTNDDHSPFNNEFRTGLYGELEAPKDSITAACGRWNMY
jgi:hypothetical protein